MNKNSLRTKTAHFFTLLTTLLLSTTYLFATNYYVDADDGNDSNTGTSPLNAWRTISKVNNSSFQPGDSVLFQRGDIWNATLSPINGGTKSNPIIFSAFGSGIRPTFDGSNTLEGVIEAKYSYLRFMNLRAVNSNGWAIRVEPSSGRNSKYIYDVRFDSIYESDNSGSGGIIIRNIDTLYVTNCTFRRYKNNGIAILGTASFPAKHTWILDNYFDSENNANGGVTLHESPTGDLPGNGHVIKNNEFYNHNEEAMDLQGGNIIVENNLCVNGGYHGIVVSRSSGNIKIIRNKINRGGINTGNGIEVRQSDVTIAYNLIYGGSYRGISIMDPGSPDNIRIYNNTIYQPVIDAIQLNCTGLNNLTIKNNIIYNTQSNRQILNMSDSDFNNPGWVIDHNLYYASNQSKLFYEGLSGSWYNLSEFQSVQNQGINSEINDPLFIDASNENFNLNDGSPAINAGDNTVWNGVASVFDIKGTRITNSTGSILTALIGSVDIGAFEYTSSPMSSVYGDVDFNGSVQSFDAATTLQYSIGMNPFPVVDPAPWSSERATIADVDGNSIVQAYDAALIQQYVVGMLDSFPVGVGTPKQQSTPSVSDLTNLIYSQDGNNLVVSANLNSDLFALNMEIFYSDGDINFDPASTTEFSQNYLLQENDLGGQLRVGLISVQPPDGYGELFRIPFSILSDSVSLEIHEILNSQEPLTSSIILHRSPTSYDASLIGIPATNKLYSNYPNPFNPATNIKFDVKNDARVILEVYDIRGKKVKTLLNESRSAGSYNVLWDGTDQYNLQVASGMYFFRIRIGSNFQQTKRMTLIR